ncbi:SEFIR domain-containing protein [Metabacillus fastidiosus]|uniref:SEFIR domain-containing protein n=1 Tax=Metabacillus fastidiosus TaxID=1458 RepID=UPI002E1CDC84|nr:TIR domain-containing protein [Metabacillus fastidiosus]
MTEELKADKVFISYSWTSPEHEQWVQILAERLHENEIDVVYDKWDLEEGQSVTKFMERSVNDPDIQKVLIICDKGYMEKSLQGKGGVGTESLIISEEVYSNFKQTKFIAVISELDEDGKPYLPTFLKGRKYFDMSSEEAYEEGYRKIVRNLYHKPELQRPASRNKPLWLIEDKKEYPIRSQQELTKFIKLLDTKPNRVAQTFVEFQRTFYEDFTSFSLKDVKEFGELEQLLHEHFQEMIPLRNVYISFLESYISSVDRIDVSLIIHFFEGLYPLIVQIEAGEGFYEQQFDHKKLFVTELVIYTIAVLLDNRHYKAVCELATNHYFIEKRGERLQDGSIGMLCFYSDLMSNKIKSYKSPLGELFARRANHATYKLPSIIQADLLLDYLGKLDYLQNDHAERWSYYEWYSRLHTNATTSNLPLFYRLKSRRHVEEIKELFETSSGEILCSKFQELDSYIKEEKRHNRNFHLPLISFFVPLDEIGKY